MFTPDTLICFIAGKVTDKYRFMSTSISELLSFSEDLVYIASGIAAAPLSCPSPRDNSLFQSLVYILYNSGFIITLAKACYCYPEQDDVIETVFKWLEKHKAATRKRSLEQILLAIKKTLL